MKHTIHRNQDLKHYKIEKVSPIKETLQYMFWMIVFGSGFIILCYLKPLFGLLGQLF